MLRIASSLTVTYRSGLLAFLGYWTLQESGDRPKQLLLLVSVLREQGPVPILVSVDLQFHHP